MMAKITSLFMKFLDIDSLCALVARAIACILAYASKKGGKTWENAKAAIALINVWTSLFMQVYDDETLTLEEEAVIADAIKNKTSITKLVDIVKKETGNH